MPIRSMFLSSRGCLPMLALLLTATSFAIAQETNSREMHKRVEALYDEARELLDAGDRERALAAVPTMAALDAEHPKVYLLLAEVHASGDRWDEARRLMDELGSNGAGRRYGEGCLLLFGRKYDTAVLAFTEAGTLYHALGHLGGEASSDLALGNALQALARSDEARDALVRARTLFDRLGDPAGASAVLVQLARIDADRGDYDAALARQREALALREAAGDVRRQGSSWQDIGRMLRRAGRHEEAIAALERAIALRRTVGDRRGEFLTLEELTRACIDAEKWDEALSFGRTALDLAGALDERE